MSELTFESASAFTNERLAELFTAGYEGYYVPVQFDVETFVRHAESGDVDLDASRVALRDRKPVAICVLGIRGDEGWIGGLGVVADERRRGVGDALMRAVLAEARRRGVRRIVLEVLEQNEPARRLYERLGFIHVRDLEVWSLEADPRSVRGRDLTPGEAHTWIRERRTATEPWQRADETVARLDRLDGVAVDGGAAIVRVVDGRVNLLQAAARDAAAACALVAAARRRGKTLSVLNLPPDDVVAAALHDLGGRVVVRQHELALLL